MCRVLVAGLCLLVGAMPVFGQRAGRGLPAVPFSPSDLAHLRWIEGTWRGDAPGESPIYERYRFVNDSMLEIDYFADPSFREPRTTGRVYVTVGRIYQTSGAARWAATHVGPDGAEFVPQQNVRQSVLWSYQSPTSWTETVRTSATGVERTTIYQMRKVSAP